MIFDVENFGDALKILEDKGVKPEIFETLHALNPALGYKIKPDLPTLIKEAFFDRGWEREVLSRLDMETHLKGRRGKKGVDLRHPVHRVDIEIERGNVASVYRCAFKFNIHKRAGDTDVGILITADYELSRALGENIAWFGRTVDELRISWNHGANADCPLLVIGLKSYSYPDEHRLIEDVATRQLQEVIKSRERRLKERKFKGLGQEYLIRPDANTDEG